MRSQRAEMACRSAGVTAASPLAMMAPQQRLVVAGGDGERIVASGVARDAQVGDALALDEVGGHRQVDHRRVHPPEGDRHQAGEVVRLPDHLDGRVGAPQVLVERVAAGHGHPAAGQVLEGQVSLGPGPHDDHVRDVDDQGREVQVGAALRGGLRRRQPVHLAGPGPAQRLVPVRHPDELDRDPEPGLDELEVVGHQATVPSGPCPSPGRFGSPLTPAHRPALGPDVLAGGVYAAGRSSPGACYGA